MGVGSRSPSKRKMRMEKIVQDAKEIGMNDRELKQMEKIENLEKRIKELEEKFKKIKRVI